MKTGMNNINYSIKQSTTFKGTNGKKPKFHLPEIKISPKTTKIMKKTGLGLAGLAVIAGSFFAGTKNGTTTQNNVKKPEIVDTVTIHTDTVPSKPQKYTMPDTVIVKKGDTMWGIAENLISEGGTKEVSQTEISKATDKFVYGNGYEYPDKEYDHDVLIYPGDKLSTESLKK